MVEETETVTKDEAEPEVASHLEFDEPDDALPTEDEPSEDAGVVDRQRQHRGPRRRLRTADPRRYEELLRSAGGVLTAGHAPLTRHGLAAGAAVARRRTVCS